MSEYSVVKQIRFCYGHRLLEYSGKCRHLHGHNGLLEIEVVKDSLDSLGMVVDFSEISRVVKKWVDDELDHKMLLCEKDPIIAAMKEYDQPYITLPDNPTAENIAKYVFDHCTQAGLPVTAVHLWETTTSKAVYRG